MADEHTINLATGECSTAPESGERAVQRALLVPDPELEQAAARRQEALSRIRSLARATTCAGCSQLATDLLTLLEG